MISGHAWWSLLWCSKIYTWSMAGAQSGCSCAPPCIRCCHSTRCPPYTNLCKGEKLEKGRFFVWPTVVCEAPLDNIAALTPAATVANYAWTCRGSTKGTCGQCCIVGTAKLSTRSSAGLTAGHTPPSQVARWHAASLTPCSIQQGCTSGISTC